MLEAQRVQKTLRPGRQPDQDAAAVGGVPLPADQTGLLAPVDQADRAVVADVKPLGQLGNRWVRAGKDLHEEEQRVLRPGKTGPPRRLL